MAKQRKKVEITLIHVLSVFTQHDFENDLIFFFLYAIDDTKHVLVFDVSAVLRKSKHEIVFSDLRQLDRSFVALILLYHRCNSAERYSEELLDFLYINFAILSLNMTSMSINCRISVFANEHFEFSFQETFLVEKVFIC